jgi:hypothetical protein
MKQKKQIKYKEKVECPICLQKIKYKLKTECKHFFCDICIVKHLMIKDACPMCRRVCDYEYITQQISSKRRKFLMRKLIQPVEINNTAINTMTSIQPIQPMSVYSRFIPDHLPASIIMISLFIIEVSIISYIVVLISQTVISMM